MRLQARPWMLLPLLAALAVTESASGAGPVLHVPIPENLEDDWSLGATVAGDLPAALETKSGLVRSPDARKPPEPDAPGYGKTGKIGSVVDDGTYAPDRNTAQPDVLGYDEPFRPATAPFKRLSAFDAVDASYKLYVRSPNHEPLTRLGSSPADGTEEPFFADIVVDLQGASHVRIPSVAPGARVVHAHVAAGERDIPFALWRDGADNWFVSSSTPGERTRARLVMELSSPRAAFGGEFANPAWADVKAPLRLPPNVSAAAQKVAAHIGVSRAMPFRDALKKLVAYHRGFTDSTEPPTGNGDIYLDLALSKKGVCRHRAFSFLVTALGLGMPARMVINEAHAWVEVNDTQLWRRIDLGGAGRTANEPLREGVAFEPPPDPFQWPSGARPGETLLGNGGDPNGAPGQGRRDDDRRSPGDDRGANGRSASSADDGASEPNGGRDEGERGASSWNGGADPASGANERDERPRSTVTLTVTETDAKRGSPLRVSGTVVAEREACSNVVVEIFLREVGPSQHPAELRVGSVATDARGRYQESLVVPANVPVGDYEMVAKTSGNMRCGKGH